nr:uncharacterized protein LOC124808029 [Hydra vulgaris]
MTRLRTQSTNECTLFVNKCALRRIFTRRFILDFCKYLVVIVTYLVLELLEEPSTGNSIDVPQNLVHPKLFLKYLLNDLNKITGRIVCNEKVCLTKFLIVEHLDYMFKVF